MGRTVSKIFSFLWLGGLLDGNACQGGSHFLSASDPVFLLQVDIGSTWTWVCGRRYLYSNKDWSELSVEHSVMRDA